MQGAVLLFDPHDFHHMFEGQRFEIEAIRGVVVGRNGLGVAIDHDGFIARLGQRKTGVTAAIVKFDALSDPVGTTAQNHDFPGV